MVTFKINALINIAKSNFNLTYYKYLPIIKNLYIDFNSKKYFKAGIDHFNCPQSKF